MISIETFRKLALSFPEAEEQPHFEKPSFRIKKKIFATLSVKENQCVLKLSPIDQSVFVNYNNKIIYPVKGAWGKQGWTMVNLKKVRKDLFTDALTTAYCSVAPKKLASMVRPADV
jgi:predicted DNA-binding protein (MmcQ/YjbR family)